TLLLDGALEEAGTHTGVGDALREVLEGELGERLRDIEEQPRPGVVELEGDLVVRVQAGRDDDVDIHLLRDALDAGEIAPQPEDRWVEDRVDPERGELP